MNGSISLSAGVLLNLNEAAATNARNLDIGGGISGGAGIVIQGAQTASVVSRVNLSAPNSTISTAITINMSGAGGGGIVSTSTGNTITGTITNNSSGLTILGATTGNDLTLSASAVISGSQGLQFSAGPNGGAGTVTLNSQSTYSGPTIFNAANSGVIKLGVSNALPTGTAVTMGKTTSSGGIWDLNGFNQEIASLTSGAGGGSIRNNATNTTSTLTVSGSANPASFDFVISDGNGKMALERAGTGTLTLSAQNTYTGGTTVSGGTLVLGHATNTLADSGAVTVSGGTLSLGSNSDTVGAIILASGSITGTGTLTGSSYDVRSGTVSANLGGSAALTKNTAGTVTLAGADNQYSGGTTINAGTLLVTGGNSPTGSGAVIVNSGGTLGGNMTSGGIGPTTVAGGTIAPGLGGTTTGILQVSNNVTFQGGSTFEVQIKGTNPGTDHDQLFLVAGNVVLDGTLSADFSTFSPAGNEQIVIIRNNSTSGTLTGTFSNYADGDVVANYAGYAWKIYYGTSADALGGTNGNDVVIIATPVPEPSSILAICALAAGVALTVGYGRRVRVKT
jgi:autotransporter-associated beta strand protein